MPWPATRALRLLAALLLSGGGLIGRTLAVELTYPTPRHASAGLHTLTIEEAEFHPLFGFNTRKFNVSGTAQAGTGTPTFRMNPGETLQVLLVNNLDPAHSVACTATAGEFCETSVSNMHTHGLHVSSKGVEDGWAYYSDDIFAAVNPGNTQLFKFTIPDDHMGGTHWYHPHHHHATAMQAGGGAAGALIVEDPPGYLPDVYANMQERILFVSGHNLATLQTMATSSQSVLWTTAVASATNAGQDTNVFLVNGQMGPDLTLASHTWYRFRFIFAAVEQSLTLSVTPTGNGGAACTLKLIAKDGVYLPTIPRDITQVLLFPGARADVAVSCTCTTYPCTATLGSAGAAQGRRQMMGGMGGGGAGPGAAGANAATVDLLTLTVTQTANGQTATLPSFTPTRPCYLADLRSATPNTDGTLNLNGGARSVQYNNQGQSMTYANLHANGGTMRTWPAVATLPIGQVHQLVVTGTNAHPLHIHIQPFQITAFSGGANLDNGYFAVGDWHDTLLTASAGGGTTVTVRMQTDTFTGKAVVHCHILEHEDEGMMAWFSITGIENTTYAAATTLDPTCYRGVFSSTSGNTSGNTSGLVVESGVKSSHANYVRDASLLVVMWSWLAITV